jgi:hypothetical protein
MIRHLASLVAVAAVWHAAGAAQASWIFAPSYYSHDPATGQRVAQFAPEEPAYAAVDPTFMRSGYRHNRTTLRGLDGTADRMHVVETWGEGESIRPYGEWEYPFRAGATPYGPWGNPQGPWTSPYGAWVNPYGLGRIPQVYDFNYNYGGGNRPHDGYPSPGPGGGGPGGPHGPGGDMGD